MRLVVSGLRAGYAGAAALHGVNIEVHSAEIVALVGRNGVGKTTLVRTLMGLLSTSQGRLELDGEDITRLTPSKRVRRGMRAVYQERSLFSALTVAENLRVIGFGPRGSTPCAGDVRWRASRTRRAACGDTVRG